MRSFKVFPKIACGTKVERMVKSKSPQSAFLQLLRTFNKSQFEATKWSLFNSSSTNKMKLTKSSFYSNLKFEIILNIEWFSDNVSSHAYRSLSQFPNKAWHGSMDYTMLFLTTMSTYSKNFRFLKCDLYLIWIIFNFSLKIH